MENNLNIENDKNIENIENGLQLSSRRNTIKNVFTKLISIIFPEIIFLIIMFFLYREYDSHTRYISGLGTIIIGISGSLLIVLTILLSICYYKSNSKTIVCAQIFGLSVRFLPFLYFKLTISDNLGFIFKIYLGFVIIYYCLSIIYSALTLFIINPINY